MCPRAPVLTQTVMAAIRGVGSSRTVPPGPVTFLWRDLRDGRFAAGTEWRWQPRAPSPRRATAAAPELSDPCPPLSARPGAGAFPGVQGVEELTTQWRTVARPHVAVDPGSERRAASGSPAPTLQPAEAGQRPQFCSHSGPRESQTRPSQ